MTPWTVAHQAPESMGFSRQEYWSERDQVEGEVGGGNGMGNTRKSMADSFQCMTKPTTIL